MAPVDVAIAIRRTAQEALVENERFYGLTWSVGARH
jgi:hypothetical protein